MQGWGGSNRGGVDHTGVGWVIQGWGWSQRGGVGHAGVKWVIQGWGGSCRGEGQVGHREAGWVGHKNIKILKILIVGATGYLIQQIKLRSAWY